MEWSPGGPLPRAWRRYDGVPHPTPIREPTNLASTAVDTNALTRHAPRTAPRAISHVQAEAAALACRALATPPYGFCLGDGTGVGKSRTLAAVLLERTHAPGAFGVWVTTSATLCHDIVDEVRRVAPEGDECAIGLLGGPTPDVDALPRIAIVTYRYLVTRPDVAAAIVGRLLHACGDATVVLDEAHVARSRGSAVGRAVAALQAECPRAGFVYSTATAASCATRMAYMERAALWGEFGVFYDHAAFCRAVGSNPGALELVGMHMKRTGRLLTRELGVSADGVDTVPCPVGPAQGQLYDDCADFLTACGANAAQRLAFFGRLVLAFKAPAACERAAAHVARGRRVLISMQLTGATARGAGTAGGALGATLRTIADAALAHGPPSAAAAALGVDALVARVPREALAQLRETLAPLGVAVLTGGLGAAFTEGVRRFQAGEAAVALLSSAATQGVSLHDVGTPAPAQRVHIMLQVPWSPESFAQQCGRSCRAGQCTRPRYELVLTDIPGEARWTSTLRERLRRMGAITRGDVDAEYLAGQALEGGCDAHAPVRLVMRLLVCRAARHRCLDAAGAGSFARRMRRARQAMRNVDNPSAHSMLAEHVLGAGSDQRPGSGDVRAQLELLVNAERGAVGDGAPPAHDCSVPAVEWAPATHALFPQRTRGAIETFLLVANRHDAFPLPTDLAHTVCRFVADAPRARWGTDADALAAARALRARGIVPCAHPSGAHGADMQWLLNAALAMRVADQRALFGVIHQAEDMCRAHGVHSPQTMNLRRFVLRARTGDMRVRATLGAADRGGVHALEVTVEATGAADLLPAWEAAGRVLAVGVSWQGTPFAVVEAPAGGALAASKQLWYPGRAQHAQARCTVGDVLQRFQAHAVGVRAVPSAAWRREWAAERGRYAAASAAEAARLGRTVRVATHRALSMWETSRKRVLRCTPPEVDAPFTCLVLA